MATMAAMLETPSRVWRRIEAVEDRDMPSLPSLPAFEDSDEGDELSTSRILDKLDHPTDSFEIIHSTPAALSHHASTLRAASSTATTVRLSNSIASRSVISSSLASSNADLKKSSRKDSSNTSLIPTLPDGRSILSRSASLNGSEEYLAESIDSVPEIYLPPADEEHGLSLTEALASIDQASPVDSTTPKKFIEYSVSLRSEPKASSVDKFRHISLRKRPTRARTPSLSRTTPSPASSPTNSTPQSNRSVALEPSPAGTPMRGTSIPLPRSRTASPAIVVHRPEEDEVNPNLYSEGEDSGRSGGTSWHQDCHEDEEKTMDETDIHISPISTQVNQYEPHNTMEESDAREIRESTFTSEEASVFNGVQSTSAEEFRSNVLSSPAPSACTSTPAPVRRAHFELDEIPRPFEHTPEKNQQDAIEHEEPLTPHTRRRSFLLSVINSNARPRTKLPTPHPRRLAPPETPGAVEASPDQATGAGLRLQNAFAGVTPRPRAIRGRMSHPLAQAFTASSPSSDSRQGSVSPLPDDVQDNHHLRSLPPWATPKQPVSYDGASERGSFISTASSHDLTTHHRANTSFDPVLGLGAQGHGLGRFNANKLNAYLHGLNRRLQEENEALSERVRQLEESDKTEDNGGSRRSSLGNRRASIAATNLGDVEEDVGAEGWMEEKAELEGMIDELETRTAQYAAEKDEAGAALETEKAERARDKERWKERMGEVEKGVEGIVRDLEKKLVEAEKRAVRTEHDSAERERESSNRMAELEAQRDDALNRAAKAEQAMETGKDLGGELRGANERISHLLGDLRNANAQVKELQEQLAHFDGLDQELQEERSLVETLETEMQVKVDELATQKDAVAQLEAKAQNLERELAATQDYVAELEHDAGAAAEIIETLESKLETAQTETKATAESETQARQQIEDLELKAQRSAELARQMEDALEAAEGKMLADDEKIAELQGRVQTLEKERDQLREKSTGSSENRPTEEEFEALETELDNAHREIARLTSLLDQSPARKAMEKARDAKVEMLEKEKEELMERIRSLKTTVTDMNTPSKLGNAGGISLFHRHALAMSVRDPRTPGGPLKEMSWLKDSPLMPAISPYVDEISRLQRDLDRANQSIDDKLDKLEDAGLGVVTLTAKLEDARSRVLSLEDEVARLVRKEERRLHRLERLRCKKCLTKFDMQLLLNTDDRELSLGSTSSLPTEPPTPPTKTSEALRANLHAVNSDLVALRKRWAEEKEQLLGEKAVLQDAANRLNAQIITVKEEARKAAQTGRAKEQVQSAVQEDLDNAKKVIVELEGDLKAERARIRALGSEQNRVQREKEDIHAQLQRTESDMNDVKAQLHKMRQENQELERELRHNSTADQKARLLESKLVSTADTIEQLRHERSLLAADHKQLQRKFTEISEQATKLQEERAASQTSHDNRRHQLDLHVAEIDELRRALSDQASDLQRAEAEKHRIAAEKSLIAAERNDVARMISTLESELRRVKKDAEIFGRDLKLLRMEKDRLESRRRDEAEKADRAHKQSQAQIRVLNEQLEGQREKTERAHNDLKHHVCAADERQLIELKAKHKDECKGLLVNIRYLQAKFTRESGFRLDLGHQKQYLLVLLAQFERSERTIIASIAKIGFPLPPPAVLRKTRKLKTIALSIIFAFRAKAASNTWREHTSTKAAVVAAHQEVRRQRTSASR